jgi:hypothetical protein
MERHVAFTREALERRIGEVSEQHIGEAPKRCAAVAEHTTKRGATDRARRGKGRRPPPRRGAPPSTLRRGEEDVAAERGTTEQAVERGAAKHPAVRGGGRGREGLRLAHIEDGASGERMEASTRRGTVEATGDGTWRRAREEKAAWTPSTSTWRRAHEAFIFLRVAHEAC